MRYTVQMFWRTFGTRNVQEQTMFVWHAMHFSVMLYAHEDRVLYIVCVVYLFVRENAAPYDLFSIVKILWFQCPAFTTSLKDMIMQDEGSIWRTFKIIWLFCLIDRQIFFFCSMDQSLVRRSGKSKDTFHHASHTVHKNTFFSGKSSTSKTSPLKLLWLVCVCNL